MIDWFSVLRSCGVAPAVATAWAPTFVRLCTPDRFSLGRREMDDWLGQVLHESGMLTRLVEGLSYSAERLTVVWPKRFPTLAAAAPFARNPEKLANKVYGGRMGNILPGDGWLFRGRGLVMVTGRDNYIALGRVMGLPLDTKPELLEQPEHALLAAIAWWERNVPDAFAGDPIKVRRAVNGGTVGLDDATRLTRLADGALK